MGARRGPGVRPLVRDLRPRDAGECAHYADALVAASVARYPGRTVEATRLRVAWQAGWQARRSGKGRTDASHWPDDGRNAAFRRGFDEAGGTWSEIAAADVYPKQPEGGR